MTSRGHGLRTDSRCFAGGDRIEVGFRVHRRSLATPAEAVREVLDDGESHGDEDEADGGREEHTADDDGAQNLPRGGAGAVTSL